MTSQAIDSIRHIKRCRKVERLSMSLGRMYWVSALAIGLRFDHIRYQVVERLVAVELYLNRECFDAIARGDGQSGIVFFRGDQARLMIRRQVLQITKVCVGEGMMVGEWDGVAHVHFCGFQRIKKLFRPANPGKSNIWP